MSCASLEAAFAAPPLAPQRGVGGFAFPPPPPPALFAAAATPPAEEPEPSPPPGGYRNDFFRRMVLDAGLDDE